MSISSDYNSGGFHTEAYYSINSLERQVNELKKELSSMKSSVASMKTDIQNLKRNNQTSQNKMTNAPTPRSLENAPTPRSLEMVRAMVNFPQWTQDQIQGNFDRGWSIEDLQDWVNNE